MTEAATMTVTDELAMLEQQVKDGTAPRTAKTKIRRLRERVEKASLGALSKVLDKYEFTDGVLVRARLRHRRVPPDFTSAPQWSTVRDLDLSSYALDPNTSSAFVNGMPVLHTLRGLSPRSIPASPCRRIIELQLSAEVDPEAIAAAFPSLRRLSVGYVFDAERFWSHPFIHTLESVSIRQLTWTGGTLRASECHRLDTLVDAIEFGPPLTRMELSEDAFKRVSGEVYGLVEVLAAARRKGAEVVLTPPSSEDEFESPYWYWDRY